MLEPFYMRVAATIAVILQPVLTAPSTQPSSQFSYNGTSFGTLFPGNLLARDDDVDSGDHSDIVRMAAIGDSYSAGIGAGDRLGSISDIDAWKCSRYDHSYPWILHNDPALGDPASRTFQFRSCSGALADEVREKQIPAISFNQQVILLSAGGNDVGLVGILNACVYQFLSLTKAQVAVAKVKQYKDPGFADWIGKFDFDAVGRSCDEQLDYSQGLIDGSKFSTTLDTLLTEAKKKLALSGGKIYYTGYAKFFAESLSAECNQVSWTTFANKIPAGFREPEYLTVAHRSRMNSMVDAVNAKIKAAVERAGPSVTFVDYDSYVGRWSGRFCENGVDESTTVGGRRIGLMFYELSTSDPFGLDPWKRSEATSGEGSYQGDLSEHAQIHLALDESALNYEGLSRDDGGVVEIRNPLPDGYGRTFHPQVLLHQIIASKIIYHMNNDKALANAQQAIPEIWEFSSCPAPPQPPNQNLCFGTEGSPDPAITWVHRILPLGASISYGTGSSTGNGYREYLRNLIVEKGGKVNYVGSRQNGTMMDRDMEATPGHTINDARRSVENSLPYLPNVVLIHVGSNDAGLAGPNLPIDTAHKRMADLINRILQAVPECVVLVSTLMVNGQPILEERLKILNDNLRAWVAQAKIQGKLVHLVDMHDDSGVTLADLVDGTHPNDVGYEKMAKAWYKGLQEVWSKCWIKPPRDSGIKDDAIGKPVTVCEKDPANAVLPTVTQNGAGLDDGVYEHHDLSMESFWVINFAPGVKQGIRREKEGVRFADLDGDGLDDYIWVGTGTLDDTIGVMYNLGRDGVNVKWGPYTEFKKPGTCSRAGVRFIDIDGDGRYDFVCLFTDGKLQYWRNGGTGGSKNPPTWISYGDIKPGAGLIRDNIRFADIDGDGRVDFVVLSRNGKTLTANAWRNHGQGPSVTRWDYIGVVLQLDLLSTEMRFFRFIDLNGDGRDDFIVVSDIGQIWTWINHRGYEVGMAPVWVSVGLTTEMDKGRVTLAEDIVHGRIRGTNRNDLLLLLSGINDQIILHPYSNEGRGGTVVKGDGCRYCDMRGRGSDDYIWMKSDGSLHLFGNNHNPPTWDVIGDLPIPIPLTPGIRKDIHLADIDGDGKCDYIWVDPKTNHFTVWLNLWTEAGGFLWGPPRMYGPRGTPGLAGTLDVPCPNHYTKYQFDLVVRFADIDGDGRVDYLCLDYDGRVTANLATGKGIPISTKALNLPAGYATAGQVKFAEGADRAMIRFADINGDGRADYLWITKAEGSVRAWTSLGHIPAPIGGSSFTWAGGNIVSPGQLARGETINYGNIKGLGRADLIIVEPATAKAKTWYNLCPGSGGSGPMPILPPLPGCQVC